MPWNKETYVASRRPPFVIAFVVTAVLCGAPGFSQSTGRIAGVVRNATGAPIPGATITVTNEATHSSQTAMTSTDGS